MFGRSTPPISSFAVVGASSSPGSGPGGASRVTSMRTADLNAGALMAGAAATLPPTPGADLPPTSPTSHSTGSLPPAAMLRSLLRITEALTSEVADRQRAYEAILFVVRDVTGAQRVSLQLADPTTDPADDNALVLVAALGLPRSVQIGQVRALDQGIAGWVLRHRQPLLLNGATHPDAEVRSLMRAATDAGGLNGSGSHDDASAICVPLIAKGRAVGVLNAMKFDAVRPFEESDRDFLAVLAGQAAIALDHARLFAELAQQATTDAITGLLNHAAFQTRLGAELERAARTHQPLALLSMDLDGFKLVNDTYGHQAGDHLLKLVAEEAILASIRPYDIACRPGGDEFAVILPHASADQAMTVAERIREAVATCDTAAIGVPAGTIATSLGVAHFPTDGMTVEDLVHMADNALYFAKYLGRNRVERGSSAIGNFERDPRKLHELLVSANTSTVEALAAAIDARDAYTAGHSRRVAQYAGELAMSLGKGERFCHDLRLACLFHDVGKIGIPDGILRKPGKLSDDEFTRMREHPVKGAELLSHVPVLSDSLPGIRWHHERWDGKGYPDGLAGEDIPEQARIIAIADAYDAMTSDRVYRSALLNEDVIRIFEGGAGIQWDPTLIEAWSRLLASKSHPTATGSATDSTTAAPIAQ